MGHSPVLLPRLVSPRARALPLPARPVLLALAALAVLAALPGCRCDGGGSDSAVPGTDAGSDTGVPVCDPSKTLAAVLPPVPAPTGGAPGAFAGVITSANAATELIGGDAATAMEDDFFLRNDRIRTIIMAPSNFYAWTRYGGNLIDADVVRAAGEPGNDQFGKLSSFYRTGRTAKFDTCEVLQTGEGGGAAAIRCIGTDALLDALNVASAVPLPLAPELVPEFETPLQIAATYVLEPGADHVSVTWTFFNTSTEPVATNLGYLLDTGGIIEVFQPKVGFGALSFSDILSGGDSSPYIAYQGPGVAYGIVPINLDETGAIDNTLLNAQLTISGVSVTIFRAASILEAFNADVGALQVAGCGAMDQSFDFVVSGDVGASGTHAVAALGLDGGSVSGTVTAGATDSPADIRVVALFDFGTVGTFDSSDIPWATFQTDEAGNWGGDLPAGDWLFVTDAPGRELDSAAATVTSGGQTMVDLFIAQTATIDYSITDATTGLPMPGRVLIVGDDPSPCSRRLRDCDEGASGNSDRLTNRLVSSVSGSSTADGAIAIEAGSYRVYVTRGPEWTVHEEVVMLSPGENTIVGASLTRVVDTTGYVAGDFHQHAVRSPDAPVRLVDRVAGYAAEGIEYIASSDHDVLTDYEPILVALGADVYVESSIGVETTPFDYGHFNAFPLIFDPMSPNGGAIDWANGEEYLNLSTDAVFAEYMVRGAEVIQVNHPRNGAFMSNFDQAGLMFDYATGYVGDAPGNEAFRTTLRLPTDEPIFSPLFDAFEVWNGFSTDDTNADGVLEDYSVDAVLYDWLRFTAFGMIYTGMGNSDSHRKSHSLAGYPRTMVAVPDDSSGAIGSLEADVMGTLNGAGPAPRDTVITNGPMLRILDGSGGSVVGRTLDASAPVLLTITIESAELAPFDTVEVFMGTSDDDGSLLVPGGTALIPSSCWTDRTGLLAEDTCELAAGTPSTLGATLEPVTGGNVWRATVPVMVTAMGDTFAFVRVYGNTAMLPYLTTNISVGVTASDVVAGTAFLDGTGVPAMAIAGPILFDADGNGVYDAPYAP